MLRVRLVHPDTPILNGNVVTCRRWQRAWLPTIVVIQPLSEYNADDQSFDVTVVLHASKCARIVNADTILVLAGTDLSRWSLEAHRSVGLARSVVSFRPLALHEQKNVMMVPVVIPQGRPCPSAPRTKLCPGSLVVVVIANERPEKNLQVVLDAAQFLPPEVIILIAGECSSELLLQIQRLAAVQHIGPVEEAYASMLIQHADVVLCPSHTEGLSDVFVQAVRAQTPLLCSDIPATSWLLPHYPGRFAPKDAKTLLSLLLRCLVSETYRHQLAQHLAIVSPVLSETLETQRWHELFNQLRR